ncbi:MAG: SDR family NAD(P)-dependent oxidoreductase [Pseudomonadota bacterium]
MSDRTILITGCSSGIGLDAARELRGRGWRVFASCRQEVDCERLRGEGFESPRIDYCDPASIKDGVARVLSQTSGRLDALFNNGAHGLSAAVEDLPTDALRDIFESNLFGWHEIALAVLPVMRAQGHGRIIQCGSVLGYTTMRWRGAYSATKHALEALTETMRIELRGTGIHVVLIEPGPITTDFRRKGIPYFERWIDWQASPNRAAYETDLRPRLYDERGGLDPFELPASAVTRQLIRALEAPNPTPRYFVTKLAYIARFLRRVLPDRAVERILTRI